MSGGAAPGADWVDEGNTVSTLAELQELLGRMHTDARHMRTGLARAAWGALNGRTWGDDPGDGNVRPNAEDVLESLRMGVVPAGMKAKEATFRQSLATLLAVLDGVDAAMLTVWLADINTRDPHRPA